MSTYLGIATALLALSACGGETSPTPAPSAEKEDILPAPAVTCGCTTLTVNAITNQINTPICSNEDMNFPECTRLPSTPFLCNGFTYAYTNCPLGVNNAAALEQQVGFQATAALTGDAQACQSGQALQLTITSDIAAQKPNVLATPTAVNRTIGTYTFGVDNDTTHEFPDVGTLAGGNPLYGADNYTAPMNGTLIQSSGTTITWWDNTDQGKDVATENATWDYKFVSFVQGSPGQPSCACVTDIHVQWDANQAAVTTVAEDGANSTSCISMH